jgi:uncharacterized protein
MIYLALFLVGCGSWLLSTLAAGGAGVVFIPISGFFIPINQVPPVLSIAGAVAGIHRAFIYRKEINWNVVRWLIPGTLLGAVLGVYIFSVLPEDWLMVCVGTFLLRSGMRGFRRKDDELSGSNLALFLPASFVSSAISGVVGAAGPMLNSLYISCRIPKNQIIATKAVGVLVLQLTKAFSYGAMAATSYQIFALGIIAGAGGMVGNYLGRHLLNKVDDRVFELIINILLVFSGASLLWDGLF